MEDDGPRRQGKEENELHRPRHLGHDRLQLAQDGGDIVFHSFDEGVVYLHMQGSCSGCPSSTATLKMGIENMLKHYIPEVVEVRAV